VREELEIGGRQAQIILYKEDNMVKKGTRALAVFLAFALFFAAMPVNAEVTGLGSVTETEITGGDENDDVSADIADVTVEEENKDETKDEAGEPEADEADEKTAEDKEVVSGADSDSVEEEEAESTEEGEPAAIDEEEETYKGTATVRVGYTETLSGASSDTSYYDGTYAGWTSSDTAIATVAGTAVSGIAAVTGVAKGTAIITHTYFKATETGYEKMTEIFEVTVTAAVVNHYMLSTTSSNVIVYKTTGNNEELTVLEPGVAFETENKDAYFFVKVLDGYGATTKFKHDYVTNEPNRTEFPTNLGAYESFYKSIYDTNYDPLRREDAIAEGCTYMFQYTTKTGNYGNFWTLFEIEANPVEVSVTYDANDDEAARATDIPADQDGYYHTNVPEADQKPTEDDEDDKDPHTIVLSSNTPEREGYTFAGWLAPDGKTYQPGASIGVNAVWTYLTVDASAEDPTAEFALKAVWEKDKKMFSISYDGNGFTGGQAVVDRNQPYEEGTEVTVLTNTWRKKNCEFVSWNTQADGNGKSYDAGSKITLTGNTTLYAQWKEKGTVQLRYVMVGGETGKTGLTSYLQNVLPEADNETIKGSTAEIYKNSDGVYEYKFLGWSISTSKDDIFTADVAFTPSRNEGVEWESTTWYAIYEKLPVENTPDNGGGNTPGNGGGNTPGNSGDNTPDNGDGNTPDNGGNDNGVNTPDNSGNDNGVNTPDNGGNDNGVNTPGNGDGNTPGNGGNNTPGNNGGNNNGNNVANNNVANNNAGNNGNLTAIDDGVTPLADGDNNVADANDVDANDAVANDGDTDNGLTSIDDEAVPQAPGDDTNAWALVNLIAAILTVLTSLILLLTWFIGKKKEEDEEDEYAEYEEDEDEDESKLKRRTVARLGSLIPAIVSVIVFVVTEDMRNPMVFVDRWTLLMIVILIIELLFVLFSKKKNVDDDEDQDLEYVSE
jgi:hypothetical protein